MTTVASIENPTQTQDQNQYGGGSDYHVFEVENLTSQAEPTGQ
jgi:hypothetical protein